MNEATARLTYRVYTTHLADMGYSAEDVETFVERLRPALQTEVDEGRWPGLEIEVEVIERTSGAGAGPSVAEWGESEGRPSAYRIEDEAREISNAVLEGVI